MFLLSLALTDPTGAGELPAGSPTPLARDCISPVPPATPDSGTPVTSPVPATVFLATPETTETPAAPGTPVVDDGLTVTLFASRATAGPNRLAILVEAANGPVIDAVVTLRTRSLNMDHGVSEEATVMTAPGCYVAERVALGMGGDWQAEVELAVPGAESRFYTFVLTLDGPRH